MKMIGLIGGTSYESMIEYYRLINIKINQRLGNHHSAKLILASLDFEEIVPAFYEDRWNDIENIIFKAAQRLERADVDFIAICCNTLHKISPVLEKNICLPFLHILEPMGIKIKKKNITTIGLLGTKFTMNDSSYINYLSHHFQINCVTPNKIDQEIINSIIFNELCYGRTTNESKQAFKKILYSLQQKGAQGIILGCTELFMLLRENNVDLPVFDSTETHIDAIVDYALEGSIRSKEIQSNYIGSTV